MKRMAVVGGLLGGVLVLPMAAAAHPLGNFTINQHVGIIVRQGEVTLDYIVDMAEIPTFQERQAIDLDRDDQVSQAEKATYLEMACADRSASLVLTADGAPLSLSPTGSRLAFLPGQAGLSTLRLECGYRAEGGGRDLVVKNSNFSERVGWREMVARADGVAIVSDLPSESPSARLTSYPKDPGELTPDVTSGSIAIGAGAPQVKPPSRESVLLRTGLPVDALGGLVSRIDLGPGAAVVALLAAAALGAGHALAPGHGKTIIAAYLVGNRGTVRQAAGLGLTVAVSHTIGVLALGLATLLATRSFQPEQVYPYLSTASGLIVLSIGVALLVRTVRRLRHVRAHAHGRDHHHHHHDHSVANDSATPMGWRTLLALGLTGGLVPSASAVVLLLGAINLHRVEFGLALICAFGVGMAVAMVSVGLGLVAATRFGFRKLQASSWLPRLTASVPVVMGGVVSAVGLVMVTNAGWTLLG